MKVDFKKLSKHKGYQSLKKSVIKDCMGGEGCFNINGCDKAGRTQCFHSYCNKFKWVIDRAKHYAYKTGIDIGDIIDSWEEGRTYWYMNYYQESNMPRLNAEYVLVFDTLIQFKDAVRICPGFRCPACKKVTKDPYKCEHCDWKAYGLLGTLGKGVYVFIKEKMKGANIFYPVAFEE